MTLLRGGQLIIQFEINISPMRSDTNLCLNDKSDKHLKEQEKSVGKKGGNLPRKCAVIRRTFPKEGVEKTELRFVLYKRPSGKLDKQGFLDEIGAFLKEQQEMEGKNSTSADESAPLSSWMEEIPNTPTKTVTQKTGSSNGSTQKTGSSNGSTPSYFSGSSAPSLSEASVKAMESHHHENKCKDAQGIKKALPLIEELVNYFRTLEKSSGRKDIAAMRKTSEQILGDAHKSLVNGGHLAKGLVGRVRALNDLATQTRLSVLSPVPSSSMNLSMSNVNAKSETDRT